MQNTRFGDEILDLALETVWSLWSELSLSGWTRRHTSTAVDLEPLIIFTSWLGQYDSRLRDESVDWCVSNSRLVSGIRLRNLLRHASDDVRKTFGDYSATVKSHVRVPWPGEGAAWRMAPSGKSGVADLERPALLQLRLRAICGVSARAEVLKLLLSAPERGWSASELAGQAAYGKDNVTAALDLLALAGVVGEDRIGRSFRYRLRRDFRAFVGELPGRFPLWAQIFAVVESLVRFSLTPANAARADVRAVEVGSVLRQIEPWLKVVGFADSVPGATGPSLNYQFDAWSIRLLRQWANVSDPAVGEVVKGDEARYTINRLTLPPGAWLGIVMNPGEPAKPLELPEWADLYQERPRSDTVISDDSIGAPRVAHEIMRLAEKRVGREVGDYWGDDRGLNQLIAREFAQEELWPMRHGTSMTWGETYLRAWRRDRVERMRATPRSARQGVGS